MAFECVLQAWNDHQTELRHFLRGHLKESSMSDDLLQEVFLKAMREGPAFCELDNPRGWLFRVAKNALTDSYRLRKSWAPVPDQLPDGQDSSDPVVELDVCIRAALPALGNDDREILEACDLGPLSQEEYARRRDLSLPAAKARIRRARERLRNELTRRCGVVMDASGKVCGHDGTRCHMAR